MYRLPSPWLVCDVSRWLELPAIGIYGVVAVGVLSQLRLVGALLSSFLAVSNVCIQGAQGVLVDSCDFGIALLS